MSDFRETLQELLNTDDETKVELVVDSFVALTPTFKEIDPEHDGFYVMFDILAGTAAADGVINERELYFMQALLNKSAEREGYSDRFSEDEIRNIIRTAAGSSVVYDRIKRVYGALNEDGKGEMITLVAAFCSIDDSIDEGELAFLSDLLEY